MSFGKPRLTADPVQCINCGEQYPEKAIKLKHAGRTEDGDFWNSKCPECSKLNGMQEEYAELTEAEFREQQHDVARSRLHARREQKTRRERQ